MIVLFTATLIDSELFLLSSKHIDFFGHFIGRASGGRGRARARAGAGGQIHARCEHYNLSKTTFIFKNLFWFPQRKWTKKVAFWKTSKVTHNVSLDSVALETKAKFLLI